MLAQSYQLHPQTELPVGTGLDSYMSDIVGRADISPSNNVVLQYRFRLDHNDLELRRSEVSASLGPRALNLNIGYTFYDKLAPTSPFDAREQLSSTLSAQVSHYWSTQIYTIQNLGEQAGPLQSGVRLTYDDDCFTLTADAGSRHTTSAVLLGRALSYSAHRLQDLGPTSGGSVLSHEFQPHFPFARRVRPGPDRRDRT